VDGRPRSRSRGSVARSARRSPPRRPRRVGRGRSATALALARGRGPDAGTAAAASPCAAGDLPMTFSKEGHEAGAARRSIMSPALVSLVGAGPGDPELLTVKAVKRLQEADLVLYDALVDRAALQHAPQARWAYVGKRAGRHSIAQETIERVMIRRALRGERIVRLKSGDPFV